jgi:geranylgeranyl diphosphate synthase type II
MDVTSRIERALNDAIGRAEVPGCPPRLAAAMRYAVFPRGARVRPRLCYSVAAACGEDHPAATEAAGAALELLHCASLVHDDLPCFDAADTRRGRPSVHKAFGEPLAVLTGDALIVLAFQTLARLQCAPERLAPLTLTIAQSVGVPFGIVAGQAWECEDKVVLSDYQRAKTGALFTAAAVAGAITAGADPTIWRSLGDSLGEAYQVADDVRDVAALSDEIGKPIGRDAALGRPSAVRELGMGGALQRLRSLISASIEAIPACDGAGSLRELIHAEARRLVPPELSRRVA